MKAEVAAKLAKELGIEEERLLTLLEVPPDGSLGDFALPCFPFAKERKKAPAQIAEELSAKVRPDRLVAAAKATGPYLNLFLSPGIWPERVLPAIKEGRLLGERAEPKRPQRRILIEYPSPNTNKPLHLGHVRNIVLATTLASFYAQDGAEVIHVNLNNDRGIHICKSMLAYQKWGGGEPDKKSDHFVGDYYVRFERELQKDESLMEEAREMLRRWEAGDAETRALWAKMNAWALDGFKETYARYGVTFDKEYKESDIYQEGKEIILRNIGRFTKDETGAVIADLTAYGLPNKVVLRSDGTSIYITQDIALTLRKIKEFNPDMQIWVVANEQILHFDQLFAILDLLGTPKERFFHLSYGMVELPEGKMKSREGRVVDADDLLDEMEALAAGQVRERHPDWPEEQVEKTARLLALGAIRFFIIKYDPLKNFVFDPVQSLNFEGDTGPYLQYTHARLCSILRKAGARPEADPGLLTEPEAVRLCKELERIAGAFRDGVEQQKTHLLAQQLLAVARAANTYYHAHPILKAEEAPRAARLQMIDMTRQALAEGLALIGIEAPDEM